MKGARRRSASGVVLAALTSLVVAGSAHLDVRAQPTNRILWVDGDALRRCEERTPCFATIQEAIDVADHGDIVRILPGDYAERLVIKRKNDGPEAAEADRIVIEADPERPPSGVVLRGRGACPRGFAVRIFKSSFVTLRGLVIVGAGRRGVTVVGGGARNAGIRLEQNRIYGGDDPHCAGGITISRGNAGTVILNNLIHATERNGITFRGVKGGNHLVLNNTIVGNGWNGIDVDRGHDVRLVNNLIALNGTAPRERGGRVGVRRSGAARALPEGALLAHNLVCGNVGGELGGPLLDGADHDNQTPTGGEGPGVVASPGCDLAVVLFRDVLGTHTVPYTGDDDFALAAGSPAIDRGIDTRTLGTGIPDDRLEADLLAEQARPRDGDADEVAEFDVGALEGPGERGATPTPSTTPSGTPVASATLTPSPTPTVSATPTGGVPTPTKTATPAASPTPTSTPPETATPTDSPTPTAAPACIEPAAGLVAWLPGDGNANEIQARQDGAAQNGATFAPGRIDQAFSLNGVDQYVLVPDKSNQYPGAGSFTVDAWIKTSVTGVASVVSKFECGTGCFAGSQSAYELFLDSFGHAVAYIRDTDGAIFDQNRVTGLQVTGTTVVTDDAFHHLAMARDMAAGELRLYVDGALEARSALNATSDGNVTDDDSAPDDLIIGALITAGSTNLQGFFSGLIDEVQLFDRALSDTEVDTIFNAGSDGQCKAGRATPGCAEGLACATGFPGICASGHTTCPTGFSGSSVCEADRAPVEEVCGSGTDDDCDGVADEASCRNDAAPTARDDAYDVRAGETLNQSAPGVLANDSDAEGDPLTARLARGPMAGTLSFNPDGSFAYVPDPVSSGNVNERIDLTRLQRPTLRASSSQFPVENLIDGRTLSFFNSWLPGNDDQVPFAELTFNPPVTVREIRYFASDGPRFTAGSFDLSDSSGNLLFTTGEVPLPAPLASIVVDVEGSPRGPIADVSRVRFLGRGLFQANRSVAEIQVFGDGAVPPPAAPAETNLAELFAVTLNASSFQDDFHRPEAANDDHPSTLWYAASSALQFYEIVFPIDVTATRIEAVSPGQRTDGFGSSNTLSCFGKFQLFDKSDAVLFDTGEVNAPIGILNGGGNPFTAMVPNVDGVRRLRYTETQGCGQGGGPPGSHPVGFTAFRLFGSPSVPAPRLDMFERFQSLAQNNIHSTPLVTNLTDDNGDGRIDRNDTPDIVAIVEAPDPVKGAIKVVSGDDGRELFTAGGPDHVSPWSEPAVGDLDGDGIPEIVAVHSDGNHLIAFTPASGEVQGNLTQLVQPLTFNANSTNGGFPADRAADGNLDTEWLTINIGAGTSPFYELAFPQNVEVSELRMFGNRRLTTGHDIFAGTFELFAADGTLLFDSVEVSLPAPDRDATVPVPNVGGVRRVRFTATAYEGTEPGFAELEVIGTAILPANVGRVLWVSDAHTQSTFFNGAFVVTGAVAIANLDGAGAPEIIVGAAVYDADGRLLGDGASLGGTIGGGSPAKRSAISVVSDLDLDGVPEIVAGPTAYQLRNGGLVKVWQRSDRPDGFAAAGNFDADPEAEIVIVADGEVYMLNHDGSDAEVWNPPTHAPVALPGGGSGGAPTIGDFDGDGGPEIGIAGSFGYTVLERDGSTLWRTAIMDYSSSSTGSTTFDFEQDGSVEVIYRDERFLRVYRGKDGLLLAKREIHSVTWTEEPVVADVDGDGDAELIVCGDSSGGSTGDGLNGTPGIHVFEDPAGGWAPTRQIWNQHGYHITNVNEDGTVPLVESTNWLAPGLNNFRLNTFGPDDVRGSADSFTYYANDGALDSAEATVRIQVAANRPPAFTSTPPTAAFAGLRYTYAAQATDADPGDVLTFSLPLAPAGMTIDSASGLIGWTPTADQIGDHNVTVRVQDGAENVTLQKYVITVSQAGPGDVDDDGDGLSENQGDCDDTNPSIRPGILDIPGDGIDQDCDGADAVDPLTTDDDGDGFTENQGDCDDANPSINPGATDVLGNGIDENCDGADGIAGNGVDDDGDGFSENAGDCDDANPSINPGATDVPGDGIDQNCNGVDSVAGDDMPPTVTIDAPADLAEVTAPTDIVGTADDANFLRYALELARVDDTVFTTIGSGTTQVTNGVLGRLDPTLLENGLYTVRLTAEDANGQNSFVERVYAIAGEMKVGNFRLSFVDLSVPVSGIPITIVRTYDSRVKSTEDFGVGWTLDVKRGLYESNRKPGDGWLLETAPGPFGLPCRVTNETKSHLTQVRLSDHEVYTFKLVVFNPTIIFGACLAEVRFDFVSGDRPGAQLEILGPTDVVNPDGSDQLFTDETETTVFNPAQVRLVLPDGPRIDLDRSAGVTRIEDLNGNTLSIAATGIVHSSGKSVSFTRDAEGRITRITDPDGRTLNYAYDASGDLMEFTDQAANETAFSYDARHNLLEITDPLGNRAVRSEYDADGRIVAIVDASGNRLALEHNLTTRQEVITDRLGKVSVVEYDERGNVVRRTDPLGNVTTLTYDSRDNKLSETDPLGNTTTRTYDARDNLLTETDPLGHTTSYTYNSRNYELTRTDPRGGTITRTYDSKGNLLTETGPLGNTFTHTYDARGNRLSTTDPLGNTSTFVFDTAGNPTQVTDPLGNVTDLTFDASGNPLTETTSRLVDGAPQTVARSYRYDARNRLIEETDPEGGVTQTTYTATRPVDHTTDALGRVTAYAYNDHDRLVATTFPDGTTETLGYDLEDQITSLTDRAGRLTTFGYDAAGRQVSTTYADGTTTQVGYDAANRAVTETDEKGGVVTRTYDAAGRNTSIQDQLNHATLFAYDEAGNLTSSTDRNGNITTFSYDLAGLLTRTTFPDGTFTAVTYDALGRELTTTDQAGNVTQFTYETRGDLATVTEALNGETQFAYDELRHRISQTDPLGNTTRFTYDRVGRQLTQTLPLGQVERRMYDAAGNLTSLIDFIGQTTTYTYDAMNRLQRRSLPGGENHDYAYTATGKLESLTDGHGTTTFAHDLHDRPTLVRQPDATEIAYAYDARGNRSELATPAGTTTYSYDAAHRLTSLTDPQGNQTALGYDAQGNLTGVDYASGVSATYTYDALDRLTALTQATGAATIRSYAYTLGPAGNRTRAVEDSGRRVDYTYDALFRLTREQITPAGGGAVTSTSYTYDANGNRLTQTDAAGITTFAYDANSRLLTAGATSFTYDANGNSLSQASGGDTTSHQYDALNRLTRVTAPGGATAEFTYDGLNNRVRRVDGAGTTNFLVDPFGHDGTSLPVEGAGCCGTAASATRLPRGARATLGGKVGLAQVLRETDGAGAGLADYLYGGRLLVSQARGGASSIYLPDGQQSTRVLTSAAGAVTDTYDYDAFGQLLAQSGTTANVFLYTGQQFEPNAGFYYLRARYYDPPLGRFTARDPFPGRILEPATLHPYTYAASDPVNRDDPTGAYFSLSGMAAASAMIGSLAALTVAIQTNDLGKALGAGVVVATSALVVAVVANIAIEGTIVVVGALGAPGYLLAPTLGSMGASQWAAVQRFSELAARQAAPLRNFVTALSRFVGRNPTSQALQRRLNIVANSQAGRDTLCGLLVFGETIGGFATLASGTSYNRALFDSALTSAIHQELVRINATCLD